MRETSTGSAGVAACFRLCRQHDDAAACTFSAGYKDTTKPVLTVCGAHAEEVSRWSHWGLCKSVAYDDIDGDVTDDIRYDISQVSNGRTLLTHLDITYLVAVRVLNEYRATDGGEFKIALSVCDSHQNCRRKARSIEFSDNSSKRTCDQLAHFVPIAGGKTCTRAYCASMLAPFGSKTNAASFEEAKTFCQRQGARLCTVSEMAVPMVDENGCEDKPHMIWTATAPGCLVGEHVAELESGGGVQRRCKAKHETVGAVRCCADTTKLTDISSPQ